MLLRREGVSNPPGPEEQNAYILQNQLTAGESGRWISPANADEKISDAALNALELDTADARTGRLSCPPPTREAFFAARREHARISSPSKGRRPPATEAGFSPPLGRRYPRATTPRSPPPHLRGEGPPHRHPTRTGRCGGVGAGGWGAGAGRRGGDGELPRARARLRRPHGPPRRRTHPAPRRRAPPRAAHAQHPRARSLHPRARTPRGPRACA